MTTIAYRDRVIAYDSLVTCNDIVVYKDYDKKRVVDGVTFIFTGSLSEYDALINNWFSSKQKEARCGAFVVDEHGQLYECGHQNGKTWKEKIFLDNYLAIGSGHQFALMAMDLGLSAEEAVIKASERCIYTGGIIRTFVLP